MRRTTWMATALAKSRYVRALSVEQIKQYLQGGDMGYSKPAEVNHFPSPERVLQFSEHLQLSAEQISATQILLDEHRAEARRLGAELIEAERELEGLFRSGRINSTALAAAVRRFMHAEGQYRLLHLETHRRMRLLLSEEQVQRYVEARGLAPIPGQSGQHP